MGNLRKLALGNMPMREVAAQLAEGEMTMSDLFKGYKGPALELLKKFNIRVWSDTADQDHPRRFQGHRPAALGKRRRPRISCSS